VLKICDINSDMTTGLPSSMEKTLREYSRLFEMLFIGFVVTVPLNNSFEVVAMMTGSLQPSEAAGGTWTTVLTPIYFKAIKDVFIVLSAGLLAMACIVMPQRAKMFLTRPFLGWNLFLCSTLLAAVYSFSFLPKDLVLMGLRGYWAVILVYVGAMFCSLNQGKIFRYLVAVFLFHCLLQVIQFVTDVGFSVYFEHRSPGLFMIPSTAGAFALVVYYFANKAGSRLIKILSILSLLLSNSTTGLLILVVYFSYEYRNKIKYKLLFYPFYFTFLLIGGYKFVANLGVVTGRGTAATSSALSRFAIMYLAFSQGSNLMLGTGMGIATSQALLSGYPNAVIADNTYIGALYNAGLVSAFLLLVCVLFSFRQFDDKLPVLVLFGYSMTTVVFELNPVIQIVLLLLGTHMGLSWENKRKMGLPQESKERGRTQVTGANGLRSEKELQ